MCVCVRAYSCVRMCVCVYHLFVRNHVGTIDCRSINKLCDRLTGAGFTKSINITFGKPG